MARRTLTWRKGEAGLLSLLACMLAAVPARGSQLEILGASTISAVGTQRAISPQSVPLAPAAPAASFRTVGTISFPRINLAFGAYVDFYQNQESTAVLDTSTGASSLSMRLWLRDMQGEGVELPVTLTTGVPSGSDCNNHVLCVGGPGDLPQCNGAPWNAVSGSVRYVARVLVPAGSGTILACNTVDIVLNARLLPGDSDGDLVQDVVDTCPAIANGSQSDVDADGWGDACDNCPGAFNPQQGDWNGNGLGNACEPLRINFQPEDSSVPIGYRKDYGQLYSPVLGYGWLGDTPLPSRDAGYPPDSRLATFVFTSAERTWEGVLPGGVYDVQMAIGDGAFPQGPQRAVSEGTTVWNGVVTAAGQNLIGTLSRQLVADGRLTVTIGGLSGNTCLNYVTATESEAPPFISRYVNFQPEMSPVPPGFVPDSGALYSAARGYGWDGATPLPSRDRALVGNEVLDTFVYADAGPRNWRIAVPADYYTVQIGIGDPVLAQGPESVSVEGTSWLSGASTQAGEVHTLFSRVLVLDGYLDVTIGQPGGTTPLDYVSLAAAPRDLDGDGVNNFNDDCIEIANPGQQDTDGNGVGDACNSSEDQDGDEWADGLDNCSAVPNPGQADADLDGRGDACDCAVNDPSAFAPVGEVQGFEVIGTVSTHLAWTGQADATGFGTVYDVVSERLTDLAGASPYQMAQCLADDLSQPTLTDPRVPPPARDGYLYLVRAENACGAGLYGPETARTSLSVGPCP